MTKIVDSVEKHYGIFSFFFFFFFFFSQSSQSFILNELQFMYGRILFVIKLSYFIICVVFFNICGCRILQYKADIFRNKLLSHFKIKWLPHFVINVSHSPEQS